MKKPILFLAMLLLGSAGLLRAQETELFFDDFESGNFSVLQNEGVADTQGSGLALWPNPVGNTLYLEGMDDETVSVYDNTGRLVLQEQYAGQLDVSGLAPGLYVIAAGGRATRFVKE